MQTELFRDYYKKRGFSPEQTDQAVQAVNALAADLVRTGGSLETATTAAVEAHVAGLVAEGRNTADRLLALARYFYLTGAQAIYIYFTALFGSQDVLANIRDRLAAAEGETTAEAIFAGLGEPPLGAPLTDMPPLVRRFMSRLADNMPPERYCPLLAGNNHGLPPTGQDEERRLLAEAGSLDDYLADLHRRKVDELQQHSDEGRIWCEQVITPEVVDFVRANPEILSATRSGNRLYVTKIPYDTAAWLHAADDRQRKYFLCHCPFVRAAFLDGQADINPDWCYCSGGFTKYPFELLFGQSLQVELLESPLLGHDRCRFAITLPENIKP